MDEPSDLTGEVKPIVDLEDIANKYREKGFFERLGLMFRGLKQTQDTREYKEARIELQRQSAPLTALIVVPLCVLILIVVTAVQSTREKAIEVTVAQIEDEPQKEEEPEKPDDPPPPEEMPEVTDLNDPTELPSIVDMQVSTPVPLANPVSAQPLDAVNMVNSPVRMKSMIGGIRSGGGRRGALNKYGGGAQTEAAVMKALRWLKTKQNADGSWPGSQEIDGTPTGYALLAFLSHGEKPAKDESSEFGLTVYKGVNYLMEHGDFTGDGKETDLHALCEAYGLSRNPNIRAVVEEKLIKKCRSIASRNWASGENLKHGRAGFLAMALKSAKMSGFDNPEIDLAITNLVKGILAQGDLSTGRFTGSHYGIPNSKDGDTTYSHTFGYVAGLQYLGQGKLPIVKKAFDTVSAVWPGPTLKSTEYACCPQRHNYFATMLYFNNQDARWPTWNKQMIGEYVPNQKVESGKYTWQGKPYDIGSWRSGDDHIKTKDVTPTCLVALQMMVYYRYLPTSSEAAWKDIDKVKAEDTDSSSSVTVDVEI